MRVFRLLAAALAAGPAALLAAQVAAATTVADFHLPGSQPGEVTRLERPERCAKCHGGYDAAAEPYLNWRGSLMSVSSDDPLFNAAMAAAERDLPGSGSLCARCHAPADWLEASAPVPAGAARRGEGVACDLCHSLVPPPEESGAGGADCWGRPSGGPGEVAEPPPPSGSGMLAVSSDRAARGPRPDARARHETVESSFHRDSALCGSCHDASNPAVSRRPDGSYALNTPGAPVDEDTGSFNQYLMFPLDRTYSEWLRSAFPAGGVFMGGWLGGSKDVVSTCQDCHMEDLAGSGADPRWAPPRPDLALHGFAGANTFALLASSRGARRGAADGALEAGAARSREMLRRGAFLRLARSEQPDRVRVRVVNQTGHKLPGGPAGRRMWLNVRFFDARGAVLEESGVYDPVEARLLPDERLKVYELRQVVSGGGAAGDAGGFHRVLNDSVALDTRIPPRGFTNEAFAAVQAAPVGRAYADGQYWDDTDYEAPEGAVYAEVRLYYQSVSREEVDFLVREGVAGGWGERLREAWLAAGRSAPELMAQVTWGEAPPDPEPPGAPPGVRVDPVSPAVTVVSWLPSTDNFMVRGYHVNRNSVLVETTQSTSLVDRGLRPGTTSCYSIRAFDAAGNLSQRSETVCARTPRR